MTEREAWICFSTFIGIGPQRFKLLLSYFGSAKEAWEAPISKYLEIGFSQKLASSFERHRKSFDLGNYLKQLSIFHVSTCLLTDKEYPQRLKTIEDAPFLLYFRARSEQGVALFNLNELSDVSIAVVGTRKMSAYGKDVTQKFVQELSDAGLTIISGLALGIDSVAHTTSIECSGKTIAVLGNGLDTIYPSQNSGLARSILNQGGAVVSEFPLGYPAMPHNFPTRNRIVSGMSLAVLVIEGTEKSGTLLTASNAASQGREVFAIPGSITSQTSQAPHNLIKSGAKLVTQVEDILDELEIRTKNMQHRAKKVLPYNPEEEKIMAAIDREAQDFDSLVTIVGLTSSNLLSLLTLMELKGMVRSVGGRYRKA